MRNLLPGLRKFSQTIFPLHKSHFQALAQGQRPHTLLITCSDSRIDPNLVTQTLPGEIFVVRNAGNIIPPFGSSYGGEEASIEFAIDGLGVCNVIVCGHSQCGAMAALMGQVDMSALPCVSSWLSHARGTKKRVEACIPSPSLENIIEENVLFQVDNLRTHPSAAAAIRAEKIRIFAWVYDFAIGTMRVYDKETKKFINSEEIKLEAERNVSRFAL